MKLIPVIFSLVLAIFSTHPASAWYDATHLVIAQAAGHDNWHLAVGADMAKVKAGAIEQYNHYVHNPPGAVITHQMVIDQIPRYNDPHDRGGHLYGAIIASIRDYHEAVSKGRYAEYHLGFCAHYVGDLSQPLHHTPHNTFNRKYHRRIDGIINKEVATHRSRIKIYPIDIRSEEDLIREVVRIANQALALGRELEQEDRVLTKAEAYEQISHSASLLKAILQYANQ